MANLPIIRRPSVRVSSFSFMNRPQLPPREGVETARNTNTIRQQQQALVNINSGLASLSLQLQALNQSITDISIQIKGDAVLDDIREQERLKRERTLAEQKIRQGKEGTIERKLQSVLQKPLQKIGAKANFTLAKLGQFFTILLGGFLANRAIQFISALAQGNKEKLKEITDKIVGELAQVAGLFVLINGGLSLALIGLLRFGSFVTRLAFRNLIARPFGMAFRFLRRQVSTAFKIVSGLGGVGGVGGTGASSPSVTVNRAGLSQTQNVRQLPPTKQVPLISGGKNAVTTTRPRFSMGGLFGSMGLDLAFGRPLGETIAGNAFASTALFGATLAGAKLAFIPAVATYMLLNTIGGMGFNATGLQNTELGGLRFQTPLSDFVDNIFGMNYENSTAGQRQRLISQQPDNMNPAPVVINNSSTDTSAVQQATAGGNGSANNIPFVPSGNSSNFHLLYSQLQYNVVG
jgi:hypothetical protein